MQDWHSFSIETDVNVRNKKLMMRKKLNTKKNNKKFTKD